MDFDVTLIGISKFLIKLIKEFWLIYLQSQYTSQSGSVNKSMVNPRVATAAYLCSRRLASLLIPSTFYYTSSYKIHLVRHKFAQNLGHSVILYKNCRSTSLQSDVKSQPVANISPPHVQTAPTCSVPASQPPATQQSICHASVACVTDV